MTVYETTDTQAAVAQFIVDHCDELGYPPSVREICTHMGWSSTGTAHTVLARMVRNGTLERDESKPRAIRVVL